MLAANDWITLIFSVVIATAISGATLVHNIVKHNKDSVLHSITLNRIEWIKQIRELVAQFLCAYIDKEPESVLRKVKVRIELLVHNNYSDDYSHLVKALEECCKNAASAYSKETTDLTNEVVLATQYSLYRVWTRMKIEGGQSKKKDQTIRKHVEEICGTYDEFKEKTKVNQES